jgi:hypothetical protein
MKKFRAVIIADRNYYGVRIYFKPSFHLMASLEHAIHTMCQERKEAGASQFTPEEAENRFKIFLLPYNATYIGDGHYDANDTRNPQVPKEKWIPIYKKVYKTF